MADFGGNSKDITVDDDDTLKRKRKSKKLNKSKTDASMDSNKLSIRRRTTGVIADPQSDLERSFCPFILAIGIAIIAPAVQWETYI